MKDMSTILLKKSTINKMKKVKEYERQTYNELIEKMIETFKATREDKELDLFVHLIQQEKMKELWDNREDEFWDKV